VDGYLYGPLLTRPRDVEYHEDVLFVGEPEEACFFRGWGAQRDCLGESGWRVAEVGESRVGAAGTCVGLFELGSVGDRPGT
jgi:hypothetical protein